MTEAPHIVVCVPAKEQSFSDRIVHLLTARGLRVSLVNVASQLELEPPFAAVCVVLGSRAEDGELVEAAIDAATEAQRPLFPLLLRGKHDLLEKTQWSDFTQSFWTGWRDLVLALDMEGLSFWPPDRPFYDGEVVLARAQNGLTPPNWQIYRGFARLQRRITVKTLLMCVSVIILSLLALLINPVNWLAYIVAGGFFLLLAADVSRWRLWGYMKEGPTIVITPDGFVNYAATGFEAYPFARLKAIDIQEAVVKKGRKKTTITRLVLTRDTGARHVVTIPAIYDTKLTPFLYKAPRRAREIAEHVVAAFHQTQQPASPIAYNGQKPLIFLSYAHRDDFMAHTLESTLRSCGLEPWVDRSRLKVGTRWEEEIKGAIGQCAALILLISPAAVASGYICKEIEMAAEQDKPILGFVIQRCPSIPEHWRPYVRANVRLRHGGLSDFWPVLYELDKTGVLPDGMTTRREQAAHFVLARALAHAPLPDEQVFVGGRMSAVDTLTFLGLGIGIAAAALLIPPAVFLLYAVSLFVAALWVSQIPDCQELIVIFPSGIAHNILGRVSAAAFLPSDDWRIKWSKRGGTVCQLQEKRSIAIPGRFRHHRQIAQQMIEAFQRSKP